MPPSDDFINVLRDFRARSHRIFLALFFGMCLAVIVYNFLLPTVQMNPYKLAASSFLATASITVLLLYRGKAQPTWLPHIFLAAFISYQTYEYLILPGVDYAMMWSPFALIYAYLFLDKQLWQRIYGVLMCGLPLLCLINPEGLLYDIWIRCLVFNTFLWAFIDKFSRVFASTIDALNKSLYAKQNLLSNVSHEIRTPLNAIFGGLQIIQQAPHHVERVKKISATSLTSYNHLIKIVSDILDINRANDGKLKLLPTQVNLYALIHSITDEFTSSASKKGLFLRCDIATELNSQYRHLDEVRFSQILRNLLSNAIKFTQEGRIELVVTTDHDNVVIQVKDTGIGIPQDFLPKLFDEFEQAHSSRVEELKGSGVGLSISKKLTELMGGNIDVASTAGKGSTFVLTIPLPITGSIDSETPDASDEATIVKRTNILLAEDNETNRLVFTLLLENPLLKIDIAHNGQQAIEKAIKNDYHAIFMDIEMPVMNGIEAIKFLKSKNFSAPIIACTANSSEADIAHYYEIGFNDVVTKPYLKHHLMSSLIKNTSSSA